jgi:hypothetical protein
LGDEFCLLLPSDVIGQKLLKIIDWGAKGSADPEFRHYPRRVRMRHQTAPFDQPTFSGGIDELTYYLPRRHPKSTMRTAIGPEKGRLFPADVAGLSAKLGFCAVGALLYRWRSSAAGSNVWCRRGG